MKPGVFINTGDLNTLYQLHKFHVAPRDGAVDYGDEVGRQCRGSSRSGTGYLETRWLRRAILCQPPAIVPVLLRLRIATAKLCVALTTSEGASLKELVFFACHSLCFTVFNGCCGGGLCSYRYHIIVLPEACLQCKKHCCSIRAMLLHCCEVFVWPLDVAEIEGNSTKEPAERRSWVCKCPINANSLEH